MGPRRIVAAGLLAALATLAIAPPAHAETIGGEQLGQTGRIVDLGPTAEPLPEVWAEAWILADAETGEVLAAKNPHVKRAPASTLKTLTALTVLPRTDPDQEWKATSRAAYQDGSRVGLKPGRTYTLDQLWYAVFLPSANDAAVAVAEANGGLQKTVRQMNQTAAQLQALDTVAKNPSGLDSPGQVSSVYDLALFGRAGMQREDFAHYAGTKKAMFPDYKGKGQHPIYSTNRLLLSGFKGVTGVKTGFTTDAGRTYIGAAERGNTSLIVAFMGIKESTEDAARKLLTWGFKNHDDVTPVGILVDPLPDGPSPSAEARAAAPVSGTAAVAESDTAPAPIAMTQLTPSQSTSAVVYGGALLIALALGGLVFAFVRRRTARGRHAR